MSNRNNKQNLRTKNRPAMIDRADVPYLGVVYEQNEEAERLMSEIVGLEQRVALLRHTATRLSASHDSYIAYLGEKYDLTPGLDRIERDGRLTRGLRSVPAQAEYPPDTDHHTDHEPDDLAE